MPAILFIANLFGISIFRLAIYAAVFVAVVSGALVIRHHYVALGYHKAIADVKKQDDRAVAAANKVQQKADDCAANSYWNVLTQQCTLEDAK